MMPNTMVATDECVGATETNPEESRVPHSDVGLLFVDKMSSRLLPNASALLTSPRRALPDAVAWEGVGYPHLFVMCILDAGYPVSDYPLGVLQS